VRLSPWFALCVWGAMLGGCSLLTDAQQCVNDRDCTAKGADFAGTVCSAGLCIASGGVEAGVDAGAAGDRCTKTAECIADKGAHAVCLDGEVRRCATLTSEDCTSVIGHDERDHPMIVGLMVDLEEEASLGVLAGASLALNDFQQALSGVPAAQGIAPHPLVLVVCDERADAVRAARHLVDTLSVPAILGPTSSARLIDVLSQITRDRRTLWMSATASGDPIPNAKDGHLVFRTAPSDAFEGKVMGLAAQKIAVSFSTTQARAVSVSSSTDRGKSLTQGLEDSLALNGESLASNKKSGRYASISLSQAPSESSLDAVAKAVAESAPHLVLLAGGDEQAALLERIEEAWPSGTDSPAHPTYVLASGVLSAGLLGALGKAPDGWLSRIHVVFPSNERSPVFQTFRRLLASGASKVPPAFEAAKAYDALYMIGLSVIPGIAERVGHRLVEGSEMASAISTFLIAGDRGEVGAISLPGLAARLSVQTAVDLEGASGPVDFDEAGNVETNVEIGCLKKSASGKVSLGVSELYYRAGTKVAGGGLGGVLGPCP